MKKRKEEIVLPDLENWLCIDKYDIVDIYKSILDKMKEQLGTEKLYVLWHDSKKEYQVFETTIDNIRMCAMDYDGIDLRFKNGYIYNIDKVYKTKEIAEENAKLLNIEFLEQSIKNIQKQIDEINPIKIVEEAEHRRQTLFEKYQELKKKLEECKEKTDE